MPQAAFYWQIGVTKLQKQRDWAKSSASQPYGTVRAIPAIVYMHPYDLALLERIWREVYNHQFEMGSWMLEEDLGPKNRLQMQDPRDSKRSLQTHCVFPTCQVRVVRFYVSCLLLPRPPLVLLSSSSSPPRPPRLEMFPSRSSLFNIQQNPPFTGPRQIQRHSTAQLRSRGKEKHYIRDLKHYILLRFGFLRSHGK